MKGALDKAEMYHNGPFLYGTWVIYRYYPAPESTVCAALCQELT